VTRALLRFSQRKVSRFRDRPVGRSAVLALTTLLARPRFDQPPIHNEESKFSLRGVFQ